jgi:hypothetical protein
MEISIPTDDDGYVLLQCEHCGSYFKATPSDIEDDGVLEIFCPSCGLVSENYATEDVIELALAMAENVAMDMVYDTLKKMERQFRNSPISFKMNKRPKYEAENPIRSGIEALEIATFPCCKRTAKVKPLLKMTGCYCPFCGVKNYEIE